MYKVLERFTDLQDNRHEYNPGDTFPREGLVVSEERLAELSTDKNRQRRPLIEVVIEKPAKAKAEEKPEKKETVKKPVKKTATQKK